MKRHLVVGLLLVIGVASLAAAQAVPQRVRVGAGVEHALLVKKVQPVYPAEAKAQHIQGTVVLKPIIDKEGNVASLEVISGHPMLVPPTIEAVKQWKYKPYLLNGEPVEVETQVTVNYTLADNPPAEGVAGDHPSDVPAEQTDGIVGHVVSGTPSDGTIRRVRISSGVARGLLVSKVQPEYPADAKADHVQGQVVLQATIDKEGNVAKLELVSGHPMLAPAAIEAVKQWKYRPYLLNGAAVEVETQVTVNYTLAN